LYGYILGMVVGYGCTTCGEVETSFLPLYSVDITVGCRRFNAVVDTLRKHEFGEVFDRFGGRCGFGSVLV